MLCESIIRFLSLSLIACDIDKCDECTMQNDGSLKCKSCQLGYANNENSTACVCKYLYIFFNDRPLIAQNYGHNHLYWGIGDAFCFME